LLNTMKSFCATLRVLLSNGVVPLVSFLMSIDSVKAINSHALFE
jgi:hypothetical protein